MDLSTQFNLRCNNRAVVVTSFKRRVCTVYSADFTRQRASTIRVHHMEWNLLYVSRPQHLWSTAADRNIKIPLQQC